MQQRTNLDGWKSGCCGEGIETLKKIGLREPLTSNGLGRLGVIFLQDSEDGCTGALKRCSLLVGHALRDGVQESLADDGVRGQTALVDLVTTVGSALGAVGFMSSEAFVAVAAAVVLISETNTVTLLQPLSIGAKSLDDTDTFVAEDDVLVSLQLAVSICVGKGYTKGCILSHT